MKNRSGQHSHSTAEDALELIRELTKTCPDKVISSILNRLGKKTGTGQTWTEGRVAAIRSYHSIPRFKDGMHREWITMQDAAKMLSVSPYFIRRLIIKEILPAKQVVDCAPWMIECKNLDLPAVIAEVKRNKKEGKTPRCDTNQMELI